MPYNHRGERHTTICRCGCPPFTRNQVISSSPVQPTIGDRACSATYALPEVTRPAVAQHHQQEHQGLADVVPQGQDDQAGATTDTHGREPEAVTVQRTGAEGHTRPRAVPRPGTRLQGLSTPRRDHAAAGLSAAEAVRAGRASRRRRSRRAATPSRSGCVASRCVPRFGWPRPSSGPGL
jgi:hypothetical protein